MNSGRNPACDIEALEGEYIASGTHPIQGEIIKYYPSMQGNRCGHDKNCFKKPRFHAKAKRRPYVLEEAKRRLDAAIADIYAYPEFTEAFYHLPKEEKRGRRRRSERVEGTFSLALPTILQTLNLHRMSCGNYDSGNQFRHYNLAYLVNQTGQHAARVKREIALLQQLGIIKVQTERRLNNDGSWRTTEVRIEVCDKIFSMLGLMLEFVKDRETSAKMFHEKQSRLDKNRKKRDIYRKPAFTPARADKTDKINPTLPVSIQKAMKRIGKPTAPSVPNNGVEIRDRISNLVAKGHSVKEAMEIVRQQSKPPPS